MTQHSSPLRPDRPETDPEKDLFDFKSFAKHLADSILRMSPLEGLVIAIYGPWGSGKTTLLNFVRYYIGKEPEAERPVVLEFNPWWFSGAEQLTRAFFEQLQVVLDSDQRFSDSVRNGLASLSRLYGSLPLPGSEVAKAATSLLHVEPRNLVKLKASIADDLRTADTRILVVVDDIDRLTADETRELFRLVKSVADFPNVVYVLSFDRSAAARALDKFQESKGEEYLEKIIQVPFELPLPDKVALRRMLTSKLDDILREVPQEEFDTPRWQEVYFRGLDPFLRTPRQVVRLTNALTVTFPTVAGEVNPVDFVAVEGLRVFLPDVYDIVRRNQDAFTEKPRSLLGPSLQALRQFHESWLLTVPADARDTAKSLISSLFPYVASILAGQAYPATRADGAGNSGFAVRSHSRLTSGCRWAKVGSATRSSRRY